ncbi:hypothetical protein ACJX0J_034149, partial [Zea mays]
IGVLMGYYIIIMVALQSFQIDLCYAFLMDLKKMTSGTHWFNFAKPYYVDQQQDQMKQHIRGNMISIWYDKDQEEGVSVIEARQHVGQRVQRQIYSAHFIEGLNGPLQLINHIFALMHYFQKHVIHFVKPNN